MSTPPGGKARTLCALSIVTFAAACDGVGQALPVPGDWAPSTFVAVAEVPRFSSGVAGAPSTPPSTTDSCPILNRSWTVYDLATPSPYVFRLAVGPVPPHGPDEALGPPGELAICRKGSSTLLQRITIPSLGWHDEYHPELYVEDFDFDGESDFALHDGDSGPYGAATFGIYLRESSGDMFVRSEVLSALAETSIVPLRADPRARQLRVASKSGCCIHWFAWYTVEGRKPRLVKRETTEGYDASDRDCTVVIEAPDLRGNLKRSVAACTPDG